MKGESNSGKLPSFLPMGVRIRLLYLELERAPAVSSRDEMWQLLVQTLISIEDRFSGVQEADNPGFVRDGRMYPPRADNIWPVRGHERILHARTRAHDIFLAENGAIEFWNRRSDELEFQKPGADGAGVWSDGQRPSDPD